MLSGLHAIPAFSQFNPLSNSLTTITDNKPTSTTQSDHLISYTAAAGVDCAINSFWAISAAGLDQFTLTGSVIKNVGTTVIPGTFDPNLAYCNNLNGGIFSPTFYLTQNFNQPVYYDGTGVIATSSISPNKLLNCGGNGSYLYYVMYDPSFLSAVAIVRYDGSDLTTVFSLRDSITITVADLAVDTYGNVWFFTGLNNGLYQSDTLNVVSPGGQLIKQYPFSYNTLNGYGCFLLNAKLYVGLGAANIAHPNTVLPITLKSDSALAGTPISMPAATAYFDMASCSPGSPLSVNEQVALQDITVYPVPVTDILTIRSNQNESMEIILYDITSRELLHQFFTGSVTINTEPLARGIYLYKIINKTGGEKTGKILKY